MVSSSYIQLGLKLGLQGNHNLRHDILGLGRGILLERDILGQGRGILLVRDILRRDVRVRGICLRGYNQTTFAHHPHGHPTNATEMKYKVYFI